MQRMCEMDKCREEFEKQTFLSFYLANLVFDETENKYKPNEELIRTGEDWEWQAFRNQSVVVNTAWAAWQHQQAKVERLQKQVNFWEKAYKNLKLQFQAKETDVYIDAKNIEKLQKKMQNVLDIIDNAKKVKSDNYLIILIEETLSE